MQPFGSIAGPIGTAVGAAVGGLTGAINALADKNSREDDYFRSEVQSLHSSAINKGLQFVNSHPGSSELERKLGADKQQARAIGGLLLFITAFLLVEWIVTMR